MGSARALINGKSTTTAALCGLSGNPRRPKGGLVRGTERNAWLLNSLFQLRHALLEPGQVCRQHRVAGSLLAQTQENGVSLL